MWPEIRSQKKLLQPDFLPFLKDPITLSDDEQGVYNHLRNERYLGSLKPFSQDDWIPRDKGSHFSQCIVWVGVT